MQKGTRGLLLLPATVLLIAIVGTVASILHAEADRLWHAWLTERAENRDDGGAGNPLFEAAQDMDARAYAISQPAMWLALAMFTGTLVDLSRRWGGWSPRPSWFQDPRIWQGALAAVASLVFVEWLVLRSSLSYHFASGMLTPIGIVLSAYLSLFIGHRLMDGLIQNGSRASRVAAAWFAASAMFWPAVSVVILVADPTSFDLLFFSLPMTVISAAIALAFLFALALRKDDIIIINPLTEAESG